MIVRKNMAELEKMRCSGLLVWKILDELRKMVGEGVSTLDLENTAEKMMVDAGARPAFKGYSTAAAGTKFPFVLCTSVNDEIVHGMPSQKKVLKSGDIISIDTGVQLNGYYGDSAITVAVGEVSPEARRLMDVTRESLEMAIEKARPGNRLFDICGTVERHVSLQRFFDCARVCGARHRHADARGAADSELCRSAQRESALERRHGPGDRAHGECRKAGQPGEGG